jgi:hypothetical protein
MTQEQWLTATDPEGMLDFLQCGCKVSERKLRLFACSCVRRAWELLDDAGRQAVEVAEAYVEGSVDAATLTATGKYLDDLCEELL